MIQFYHFHNSLRRYVDLIGEREPTRKEEYLNVMRALSNFKRSNGRCFTYLPLKGQAYFLQTNSEGDEFVHGLIGNIADLRYEPSRYIGTLKSSYTEPSETEVGEWELPTPPEFRLSATRTLHPYVADIVEALLYTKKLVIVRGQNVSELIDCVKTVFKALPLNCAVNLGFSVAPSQIPNIFDESMKSVKGTLRLIATTAECGETEDIRVISLGGPTEKTADGAHLHPYSKVVRAHERDLSDTRFTNFVLSAQNCFDRNGTIDEKNLTKIVLVRLFQEEHNYDSAMALLSSAKETGIEADDVIEAIEFLLGDTVTEESLRAIDAARSEEEIRRRTTKFYGRFLLGSALEGHALSEPQRQCVFEYLSAYSEGNDAEKIGERVFAVGRSKEIFSLLAGTYAYAKTDQLLRLIIGYTDIGQTYNVNADGNRDQFSAGLFTEIDRNTSDRETAAALFAAVLCSCCGTAPSKSKLRFSAFRKYTEKKFPDMKERIGFLLDVKNKEDECIRMTQGAESMGDYAFLPETWLDALTDRASLSFAVCLELVMDPRYPTDDYSTLQTRLLDRLGSFDEVKENVKEGKLLERYSSFFGIYRNQLNNTSAEIEEYLEFLNHQGSAFKNFSQYRCDFVLDSYRTMAQTSKTNFVLRRVNKEKEMNCTIAPNKDDIDNILADDTFDRDKRQFVTEKVIDVLAGNCRVEKSDTSTNNGRYFLLAFLISIAYMVAAAVIFVVPQVIFGALLGENILDRILLNLQFFQIVAILYAGLLNFITYVVCWSRSNHDRQESLKRASLITLLFAGVPVLTSEIVFLIFYCFI